MCPARGTIAPSQTFAPCDPATTYPLRSPTCRNLSNEPYAELMCPDMSDARQSSKVFIGGLSWETTGEKLRAYFENYGVVREAFVSYNRNNGRPRGFGFVVFESPDVADKVVACKHTIDRREVSSGVPRCVAGRNPSFWREFPRAGRSEEGGAQGRPARGGTAGASTGAVARENLGQRELQRRVGQEQKNIRRGPGSDRGRRGVAATFRELRPGGGRRRHV